MDALPCSTSRRRDPNETKHANPCDFLGLAYQIVPQALQAWFVSGDWGGACCFPLVSVFCRLSFCLGFRV